MRRLSPSPRSWARESDRSSLDHVSPIQSAVGVVEVKQWTHGCPRGSLIISSVVQIPWADTVKAFSFSPVDARMATYLFCASNQNNMTASTGSCECGRSWMPCRLKTPSGKWQGGYQGWSFLKSQWLPLGFFKNYFHSCKTVLSTVRGR
jgi:hypothetical protein